MIRTILSALVLSAVLAAQQPKLTTLLTKGMEDVPGKEILTLTVEYAPGGSSSMHRHNAHVVVYVLEGSIVMGVKGKPPVTLGPGETFYEAPEDIHAISRNASQEKSAKFLVFMVKGKGVPPVLPAENSAR